MDTATIITEPTPVEQAVPPVQPAPTPEIPQVQQAPQPESPPSPPKDESPIRRDNKTGRWVKGNKAATLCLGKKRTNWADLFVDTIGEKEFRQVVRVVVDAAKAGDMKAAFFLLNKCLGDSLEVKHTNSDDKPYVSPDELRAKLMAQLEESARKPLNGSVINVAPQSSPKN